MRLRHQIAIFAALGAGAAALFAADPQKPEPADRKAYSQARKIEDPEKKIEALREFVKKYPKSGSVGRAEDLILDTLIGKFPARTDEIGKQVTLIAKRATGSKVDRAYQYEDLAESLADGAVLPAQAAQLIRKALHDFGEKAALEESRKSYAAAKLKPPSGDELRQQYVRSRAEMTATLGRVLIALGEKQEGQQQLEAAYRANPGLSAASAALANLALEAGERNQALDYFTQARLTGILKSEDLKQFDALYRERHNGTLDGLNEWLDSEYRKRFPIPVRVEPYKGRPQRVVLAEVFTGAGCPPCAGADSAMDAVMERYPRNEVAVLMYHQHIPHPDPMANPATAKRASYYDIHGVPSMMFDGTSDHGGGAGRAEAQRIYDRLVPEIDKELAQPAEAQVGLRVSREGALIEVHAKVGGLKSAPKDLKLQVVLVEKKLRYSGENGIRFHPMVVRSLCGKDSGGIPIDEAGSAAECSFDVTRISQDLKTYLDDYEQHNERYGKFTFSEEKDAIDPRDLAIVAFVEDPAAKHVLAATFSDLEASR